MPEMGWVLVVCMYVRACTICRGGLSPNGSSITRDPGRDWAMRRLLHAASPANSDARLTGTVRYGRPGQGRPWLAWIAWHGYDTVLERAPSPDSDWSPVTTCLPSSHSARPSLTTRLTNGRATAQAGHSASPSGGCGLAGCRTADFPCGRERARRGKKRKHPLAWENGRDDAEKTRQMTCNLFSHLRASR